jgi:hypothetical protein
VDSEYDEEENVNDDDTEEDEDADGDDEDDGEYDGKPSPFSLQATRDHVFPVLLKELENEGIVTSGDCKTLLESFKSGSHAINRALDDYDADNNMGELVDALIAAAKQAPLSAGSPSKK